MASRLATILGPILSFFGCVNINGPVKALAGKLTQVQVDEIVQRCGGQIGKAIVRQGRLYIYDTSKEPKVTACIINGLRETGETSLPKLGVETYVAKGNERAP